jgi:hypothetical protein
MTVIDRSAGQMYEWPHTQNRFSNGIRELLGPKERSHTALAEINEKRSGKHVRCLGI